MKKLDGEIMLPVIQTCGSLANMQLPDPELLQDYRDDARRVYWLDDEITAMDNLFIRRLIDWNQEDIGRPPEERKPVYLMIDTPGGALDTTFALIDAIQASQTPVIGVVNGIAYSGGFYVLLACNRRMGMKHSSYMMHRGSGEVSAPDQRAAEMFMKQWSSQVKTLTDYVVDRTDMTSREVKKAIDTDTYYSADEALKKGILTELISSYDVLLEDMASIE